MFVRDEALTSGAIRIPPQHMRAIAADAMRRSKVIAGVACLSAFAFAVVWLCFAHDLVVNRVAVRDANGVIIDTFEEPNGAMLGGLLFAGALAAVGVYYARNAIRAKRCAALADEMFEWRLAGYGIFGLDQNEYPPPHVSFTITRWERERLLRVPKARIRR